MSSEETVQIETKGPTQRAPPPKQPPAGNPPLKKKVPPPSKPPPTSAPSPSSAVATFRAKSNVPPPSTPPPKTKAVDAVSKWRSISATEDQKQQSEEEGQAREEKNEEEKKEQGELRGKKSERVVTSAVHDETREVDISSSTETPTVDKKRDKRTKQSREKDEDEQKYTTESVEQEDNSHSRKSKNRDKRNTNATRMYEDEVTEKKEDEETDKKDSSTKSRKSVEMKDSESEPVRRKEKKRNEQLDEEVDEVPRKDKKKNDYQEDERESKRERKKGQEDEKNSKKPTRKGDTANAEGDTAIKRDKKKGESKEDNDGEVLEKKERRKSISQGETTEGVHKKEKKRHDSCDDDGEVTTKKEKKKGDSRDVDADVPTKREKKRNECKDEIEQITTKKDKKKNEPKPSDENEILDAPTKKEKKKGDTKDERLENTARKERRKSDAREDPDEHTSKRSHKKIDHDEVSEGNTKKSQNKNKAIDDGESSGKSKTKGKKSSKKRSPVPAQNDLMVEDLDAVVELDSAENEDKDDSQSASPAGHDKEDLSKGADSREGSSKSLVSGKEESRYGAQHKGDPDAQAKDKEAGDELELKIGHTSDDRERKERIERFERLERLERLERFESADKEKEVIAAEKGVTTKKPQRKDGPNDDSANGDPNSVKKKKTVELFDPRCVPYVPKDLMQFVISPFAVGRGHVMRCFIERNESGQNKIAPIYTLMLEINSSSGRPIIFARKMPANRITTHYVLSLNKDDLFRERRIRSDQYIGKLRSNAGYMEYILYDGGENPENIITNNSDSDGEKTKNIADHPAISRALRCELALIVFSKSKKEGARKMEAVIPSLNATKTAYTEWKPLKQSDSIAAHFADVRSMGGQNVLSHDRMICFHKRQTKYDPLSSCIVDFKSRATCVSVKNFQLVHSPPVDNTLRMMYNQYYKDFVYQDDGTVSLPPEHVILQMGKVGKDCFNMDFQYPLSMVQAFAICLSRFDTKVR